MLATPSERCQFFLACHNFLRRQARFTSVKKDQLNRIMNFSKVAFANLPIQTKTTNAMRTPRSKSDHMHRPYLTINNLALLEDFRALNMQAFGMMPGVRDHLISSRLLTVCQHEDSVAFCTYSNGEGGVVKLVPPRSKEALILEELLPLKDPRNPILPGIHISKLPSDPSYSLIHMPRARAIESNVHAEHLTFSIRLVSGIMFLHEQGIAHLDIKQQNLMLSNAGQLSIIDFSVSQMFVEQDTMLQGFWGTPGCVAPEIEKREQFSPFLADAWACGKVLRDMCYECPEWPSVILLQAQYLMAEDAAMRPTLQSVLTNLEMERLHSSTSSRKMRVLSVDSSPFSSDDSAHFSSYDSPLTPPMIALM